MKESRIPSVFNEVFEYVDSKAYGPYIFGWCTLAEELGLPDLINKYNPDDLINEELVEAEAVTEARRIFHKKLAELEKLRKWEEEEDSWSRYNGYGDS